MDKKEEISLSNLYINKVSITRKIPIGNYLKELPVVKNLMQTDGIRFHKPVTFLVGENGVGKSTLIEAMAVACGFNPEGGTINFNFSTRSSHSDLYNYLTISRGYKKHRDGFFLRAESFYNVASNIEDMDDGVSLGAPVICSYGGVSLHKQSHGESFMSLVENRFGGNGLYILDEPEAALSPMRMMRLLCYMQQLVNNNSQFVISTHSPILMTFPNAEILEITEDGINSVDYKETEHFLITKRFMDTPEKMIARLLDI